MATKKEPDKKKTTAKKPAATKARKAPAKKAKADETPAVPPKKPPHKAKGQSTCEAFSSSISEDAPLSPKMAVFVERYLVSLNAAQALLEAGYSKSTSISKSTRLLNQPNVAKAIRLAMEARSKRTQIDQDTVVKALFGIATSNIGDFMDWSGRTIVLKDSKSIPHELKALISEVCETEDGYKIKLHDKISALRLLAQHLGMLDKSRFAKVKPESDSATILKRLREGEITPSEAMIDFDIAGLAIPESVRALVNREKEEPESNDDGAFATITPEEMEKKRQERLAALAEQKEKFVPERQAEVRKLKAQLTQEKGGDTFSQKGADRGEKR